MATPPKQATVDPDHVPELLCMGPANITAMGALAQLTFTHLRRTAPNTFGEYTAETTEAVVKARIVVPIDMLVEFRNMIDSMIKQNPTAAGSSSRN